MIKLRLKNKKSPSLRQAQRDAFGGGGEAFKILVIQQKMIGDVLTSSLICENLKLNLPEAEIHYLINRSALPVVQGHPYIDDFVIFEENYKKSKIKFYRFLKQIKRENYTHIFDAYGKLESMLVTLFSKANYRYGFSKSYSKKIYTNTTQVTNDVITEAGSAIENRLRLMQLMKNIKVFNNKPKIYLSEKEVFDAQKQFKNQSLNSKDCIMISALGSSLNKTYPFSYFAQLLDFIVEKTGKKLIFNYMPSQQGHIDEMVKHCSKNTQNHIAKGLNMKSLRAFIQVCSQCLAIIGNEGGAINMAKALDVPSFSIFSPWVTKEGWNSFETSYLNTSVHLKDFYPELYDKHPKFYKNEAKSMYKKLEPHFIQNKLDGFLNLILVQKS